MVWHHIAFVIQKLAPTRASRKARAAASRHGNKNEVAGALFQKSLHTVTSSWCTYRSLSHVPSECYMVPTTSTRHTTMKNPYDRHGLSEEESFDEENLLDGSVAASFESSLPSLQNPRYQVYPPAPTGARSLIGGFVTLDDESVDLPEPDSSAVNSTQDVGDSQENEAVYELESVDDSYRGPPSVVDLSKESSSIGATIYDSIMTFKIIGTQNSHNRPTLPSNGRSLPQPPPSILRNPLTSKSTPKTPPRKTVAVTPSTDNSFFSSGWQSPIQEITFFRKKEPYKASRSVPDSFDMASMSSHVDCLCKCCPYWIQRSPLWLRILLLVTLILLILSAALISFAIVFAMDKESSDKLANGAFPLDDLTSTEAPVPVPDNHTPPTPVTVATPTPGRVADGTSAPSFAPTEPFPTASPSSPIPSTFAPTVTVDRSVVSFFVAAGNWQETVDPSLVLPRLPMREERAFLVHLGDWNQGAVDCQAERYEDASEMWSQAACAVYFVAGSAETNGCPEPDNAIVLWRDALVDYHRRFWDSPPWPFWNDASAGFPDAWVFDTNQIAVCGLHLTAGSETVVGRRTATEASLAWIEENYQYYRRFARMIIVLANAPVNDGAHTEFFTTLLGRLDDRYQDLRFVWVQPASYVDATGAVVPAASETWQPNYGGLPNLDVISVEPHVWPPMRIEVDDEDNILLNQAEWFNEHTGLSV